MISGRGKVSRLNPYVINMDAVTIFGITATATKLMKVSTE